MSSPSPVLVKGAETAVVLLGIGGSFFAKVAPPQDRLFPNLSVFAAGLATLGVLFLVLVVWMLAKHFQTELTRRRWFGLALVMLVLALFASFEYSSQFNGMTYVTSTGAESEARRLRGDVLKQDFQNILQGERARIGAEITIDELRLQLGDENSEVWTEESIRNAGSGLLIRYLLMVYFWCLAVLCVAEGAMGSRGSGAKPTVVSA